MPITTKILTALFIGLSPLVASSSPIKAKTSVIKIDGCTLLREPAKFNGKQVEVEGLAYGAFESFSLSFECPGYVNLEFSKDTGSFRKFGFHTIEDDQMKNFNTALFPDKDAFFSRRTHHARVRLIGLFRCHYDFPDCKDISSHGDSSIVIRSVISVSKINSPSPALPTKE